MQSYYVRWIRTAFRHSLGPIDLWAGIAAAILAIVDHYLPERQLMNAFSWQIPIWALATIMIVRLLVAPYWMAQEDGARIKALESSGHDARRGQLLGFYSEIGKMLDDMSKLNKSEDKEVVIKMADEIIQPRVNSMAKWILEEMGTPASDRFSERSRQQHLIYGEVQQPQYNIIRNLEQIRSNLNTLISDPSWYQGRPQ